MELRTIVTKRWIGFFLLFFIIWYPSSLLLLTIYQITLIPILSIALNMLTPLLSLLIGYLYFRHARNDWTARLVTGFGWVILMFFFAGLLVKPVYGYDWTSIVNLGVINMNWINVVAIVIAGVVAHKPALQEA
ncbi:hypothetical protein HQ487_04050 [Candidatus Uhrbacteria bacterium]|nr:hypothetical protein [Candidatus Uhrbacteria bacterium]